jgi:hypothetical protein
MPPTLACRPFQIFCHVVGGLTLVAGLLVTVAALSELRLSVLTGLLLVGHGVALLMLPRPLGILILGIVFLVWGIGHVAAALTAAVTSIGGAEPKAITASLTAGAASIIYGLLLTTRHHLARSRAWGLLGLYQGGPTPLGFLLLGVALTTPSTCTAILCFGHDVKVPSRRSRRE